jgi:hypothetical protein
MSKAANVEKPMHRLIHALQFELKPLVNDGRSTSLVVWLNCQGESRINKTQPGSRKRRIVDLRSGDTIYAGGESRKILSISAYREHRISDDQLEVVTGRVDGWLLELRER